MLFEIRTGNIHHSLANNISNNSLTVHAPSPPPVQAYNNSHVSAAQAQAVSQALSQAQDGIPTSGQTQQSQPVEFNHAINYVNKIKVCIQLQNAIRNVRYSLNLFIISESIPRSTRQV